jgi:hypothetical protein
MHDMTRAVCWHGKLGVPGEALACHARALLYTVEDVAVLPWLPFWG